MNLLRRRVPRRSWPPCFRSFWGTALVLGVFFLLPLGGDTEMVKPPGQGSAGAYEQVELWSLASLLLWGSIIGETHLTRETVAIGATLTAGGTLAAFGVCAGVRGLRGAHRVRRDRTVPPDGPGD